MAEARRDVVASLLARIDACTSGRELTPADYADVAAALRDHVVRDCMVGLATTPRARAAQQFWACCTRPLPDPERAETAALLAYYVYVDADVRLAMLAAVAARRSDPDHRLARLLVLGLRTGMSPDALRESADNARALAAEFGIDLEPVITRDDVSGGARGSSGGAVRIPGVRIVRAANHWPLAIAAEAIGSQRPGRCDGR